MMDRQQLIDRITAVDLQIGDLRERTKSLERKIAMSREEPGLLGRARAGPCVASAVKDPLLQH